MIIKAKHIFIISIILIFLSLSCVSADDNNGNFTELQDNIDSSDTTLDLDKNYVPIVQVNVKVNKSLTINGHGHNISLTTGHSIEVSDDVCLNDINFDYGGTPTITGTCNSLIINNCNFSGYKWGSYINVTSGNVTIKNTHFIVDNVFDTSSCCVIDADSFSLINCSFDFKEKDLPVNVLELSTDEFKLINTTFTNFVSESLIISKKGKGYIYNSKFDNNSFYNELISSKSSLEIISSEFINNNALFYYTYEDSSRNLINLNANNNIIKDSKFISNNVYHYIIDVSGQNTDIIDSVFDKNEAAYCLNMQGKSGRVLSSNFTNTNGLAVSWMGNDGIIDNSIFNNNSHDYDELIVWYGSNGVISNSKFIKNSADSITWKGYKGQISGCIFEGNTGTCIYWASNDGKLTKSQFSQNNYCVYWDGNNGIVDGCNFEKNTLDAIHWNGNSGKILNCKFNQNNVFEFVVGVYGKNCLVDKCEFISNNGQHYGAIAWYSNTGYIKNSVFKYNTAKWGDAAIHIGNNYQNICKNNVFYKNTPVELVVKYTIPSNIYYNSGQVISVKIIEKASLKPVTGALMSVYGDMDSIIYFVKTGSNGVASTSGISNRRTAGLLDFSLTVKLPFNKFYENYDLNYEVDLSKYSYFTTIELWQDFGIGFYKGRCIVKAPQTIGKFHKNNYFKISVKNKFNKVALKNFKLKVKVFTGKKYKIYNVKTNKYGIALFNTKNLSRGIHKVVILSGHRYYSINSKSRIIIK